MLTGLARFVLRFRWWVVATWAAIFLASLPLAPTVTAELKSGFGDVETESRLALRQLQDGLGVPESSVTLVFSSDRLVVSDAAYVSAVESAVGPLRHIPQVRGIATFYSVPSDSMVASDRRTSYAWVELDASISESIDLVGPIREHLGETELDVWVTGGLAIFADLDTAAEDDVRRAELITLPVLAVALVIVFGGLVAAGLPVAMGIVSVVTTLAVISVTAQFTDMSIFVLSLASFLGLGMAVDYSLLMVSRFREELDRADSVAPAVTTTMETAGQAVLFSAGTSVIGLSGLLFFEFMMLRSLGIGGITVIVFSMLIALTLIPALLAILGPRVDRLTIWRGFRIHGEPTGEGRVGGGFWFSLASWVMRHPVAVIVPVTTLLVLMGLPFLDVKLGSPWAAILPEHVESREGWDLLTERFGPGELSKVFVVETSETSTLSPANIVANLEFIGRMDADPRVKRVESVYGTEPRLTEAQALALFSLADPAAVGGEPLRMALEEMVSENRRTQMISIVPVHPPISEQTRTLLEDVRAAPPMGQMEVRVTGVTAELEDTVDRMYSDFPKVVLYVAIVTYTALFFLFRSAILPLKAVVLNVLSILASFGALVFIFQWGNFQTLLGFTSEGFVEASVPILMFFVVFGLSMDYEVFLLSRVKEEYQKTGDNTHSVAVGMERSGRIITSAAAILILVCAGFATGEILITKALGLGTALAILIDSTIVRALMVPALMRIMAGLNWWSPRLLGGGARGA